MSKPAAHDAMLEFVQTYHSSPAKFVHEVLGVEPLDYQAEFLDAIANGTRMLSIRSGHGTGKSTAASWAMLHTLIFKFPARSSSLRRPLASFLTHFLPS